MVPKIRSTHAHAWRRTARFPPLSGGECDGCGAARASPACGEARRTRTLARGLGVAANKHKQTLKHLAPARRSFGQRPRRVACASRAWEASSGCADDQSGAIDRPAWSVSRWRARGGSRLLSLPAPCSTKGWRAAGPTGPPHTRTHHCRTTPHPTATRTTNAEPRTLCALLPIMPLGGASPPHTDPCPLSLSLVHSHRAAHRSHVRWRTLCSSTYAPACHAALAPTPSPLPHPHCGHKCMHFWPADAMYVQGLTELSAPRTSR